MRCAGCRGPAQLIHRQLVVPPAAPPATDDYRHVDQVLIVLVAEEALAQLGQPVLSALQGAHELLLPVAQQDVVVGSLGLVVVKVLAGRPQAQVGVVVLARPGQLPVRARRHHPPPCEPGRRRPRSAVSVSPNLPFFFYGPSFFWSHSPWSVFVLRRAGGPVSFRVFAEHAPLQSTLLCRARFFAASLQLLCTLLCRARFFAEHAPVHSTLLCRARFFAARSFAEHASFARSCAEHASLQSTLLCRALSFAEHASLRARSFAEHTLCRAAPLQSTLLCAARSFAEHALCRARSSAQHASCAESLQSTLLCALLCRARFFAQHTSLQSTLLCRALSFAEHAPLQSTLLCRARFFAEHASLRASLQSALLCRARSSAEHASLQSALLCRHASGL